MSTGAKSCPKCGLIVLGQVLGCPQERCPLVPATIKAKASSTERSPE